jgi:hypothetical protein
MLLIWGDGRGKVALVRRSPAVSPTFQQLSFTNPNFAIDQTYSSQSQKAGTNQ